MKIPLVIFPVLALVLVLALPAWAGQKPVWWNDFQKQAGRDGYTLIGDDELDGALSSNDNHLLLDVRPPYEYQSGHIPGAENLEFHEGHIRAIEPELAEAFKKLAGPDPSRPIIIYCRSFR